MWLKGTGLITDPQCLSRPGQPQVAAGTTELPDRPAPAAQWTFPERLLTV